MWVRIIFECVIPPEVALCHWQDVKLQELTIVVWCDRFAWLFLPDMRLGGHQHNLFLVCLWLLDISSFLNSSFNFFVYYVMGSRFRVTLWGLLGRRAKKSASKEIVMSSITQVTES